MPLELAWQEFIQAMLSGQYFAAHEILEIPWRAGKDHRLQIAIWIAAAYVHAARQHPPGARRIFARILDDGAMDDPELRRFIQARLREVEAGLHPAVPDHALLTQLHQWAENDNPDTR